MNRLIICLSVLLLALALSACTTPAAQPTPVPAVPGSTDTPAPTTVRPTETVPPTGSPPAGVRATETSAPPATPAPSASANPSAGTLNCGELTMLGPNPPNSPNALQAENCFQQAFQACTPATLTVSIRGVDAGTTHIFTIEKSGSTCRVSDTTASYVVPMRTPSPVTIQCTAVTTLNRGLVITGCAGQGDIVIPAP